MTDRDQKTKRDITSGSLVLLHDSTAALQMHALSK